MKKWLLALCIVVLGACGTDESTSEIASGYSILSVEEADKIATTVIDEFWDTFTKIDIAEVSMDEKRDAFLPFMTENMLQHILKKIGDDSCSIGCTPSFPKNVQHALTVHLVESTENTFTIEHILHAQSAEEAPIKQTTTFLKQDNYYIVSDYKTEPTTVAITKEQAEQFINRLGYDGLFVKEGSYTIANISLTHAYVFEHVEDPRMYIIVNKDNGYVTWSVQDVLIAEENESATDFAPYKEIEQTYAHLFTYHLVDIDHNTLPPTLQDIFNTYIHDVITQTIVIDFNDSLSNQERQHNIMALLDTSVDGLMIEIKKHIDASTFATLQANHKIWLVEREKYATDYAHVYGTYDEVQFYVAYKQATEDYLATLFYQYLYK